MIRVLVPLHSGVGQNYNQEQLKVLFWQLLPCVTLELLSRKVKSFILVVITLCESTDHCRCWVLPEGRGWLALCLLAATCKVDCKVGWVDCLVSIIVEKCKHSNLLKTFMHFHGYLLLQFSCLFLLWYQKFSHLLFLSRLSCSRVYFGSCSR